MSMKEGYEQQDPELANRRNVVLNAVGRFEEIALRDFGMALVSETTPDMSVVENTTLFQAGQSMAAISTQQEVEMNGDASHVLAA